jgi:hypothetical protein
MRRNARHRRSGRFLGATVGALLFGVMAVSASASQPKAELEAGAFPITFTGTSASAKLETKAEGVKVRTTACTGASIGGTIATATTVSKVTTTLTGCKATGPFGTNLKCNSAGAGTEEIVFNALKGTLFYVTNDTGENKGEVGLLLEPEAGAEVTKYVCGGVTETMTVTGSVACRLTPLNTIFILSFTLACNQKAGVQLPSGYLEPTGCAFSEKVLSTAGSGLESFGPLQSGLQLSLALTTSKKMKVVAGAKCE